MVAAVDEIVRKRVEPITEGKTRGYQYVERKERGSRKGGALKGGVT